MAKKNNNNGVENKNKNNDGGEKKKAIAYKIVKWVKSFQGAESVKSEGQANKLTVVGKVDPTKLRDELATKTKNEVDLVSPQPEKDNKVNKDDANDNMKKQPEKTDNDEKPKEAPFTTAVLKLKFHCDGCASKVKKLVVRTEGCKSASADMSKDLLTVTGSMDVQKLVSELRVKLKRHVEIVPPKKKNGGNDGNDNDENDDNDGGGGGSGGGGGDEKKKEEDEGNGGGKMKYPAGQSGFGQFSYRTVHRHGYGYQNGALKMGEKMLLMCCEVFGLLVMYNHLAKDIYTTSIYSEEVYFQGCKATFTSLTSRGCK